MYSFLLFHSLYCLLLLDCVFLENFTSFVFFDFSQLYECWARLHSAMW